MSAVQLHSAASDGMKFAHADPKPQGIHNLCPAFHGRLRSSSRWGHHMDHRTYTCSKGCVPRAISLSAAVEDVDVMSSVSFEHQEEGEYCMPGQVAVQEEDGPYTVITMQVKDYPGLLRVAAWVLNGLELVVKKAKLLTDKEGFAHNSFWVTDRSGNKIKRASADLIAERIGDYLVYCTPSKKALEAKVFREGPITVDNEAHPEHTLVTIFVALEIEGALLKVTSALTNSGCSIQRGDIEGVHEKESTSPAGLPQGKGERLFSFWVTDRSGNKLDYQRATSLVYTVGLTFGKSEGPLSAPNSSLVVGSAY